MSMGNLPEVVSPAEWLAARSCVRLASAGRAR